MTQWIEDPRHGRARGPRAVVRAWVEVLYRPRRFFRVGVAPGDQAPGLTFAMGVVLVEEASRLALTDGAVPAVTGDPRSSSVLALAVAVLLVTPVALHLMAAVATLGLVAVAEERAGISETVQVIAYATAPCVAAGVPVPELRAVCAVYGAVLLVIGLGTVHRVGPWRALAAGTVPAALVFGYGFRGFAALGTLLARWYVI